MKRDGLQWRMTLWVTGSVLVVSGAILLLTSILLRSRLEAETISILSEDIDLSARLIEQRMKRVEGITASVAAIAAEFIDDANSRRIDSLLCRTITGGQCLNGISLARVEQNGQITLYSAVRNHENPNLIEAISPITSPALNTDANWLASHNEGVKYWSAPFFPIQRPQQQAIIFSVPVHNVSGTRRGMVCSIIELKWITDIITRYKARKDIDVSVYSPDGQVIVFPDDYILHLSDEQLFRDERFLEGLGWKMVFSADRSIINRRLNQILLMIACGIILLLLTVALTIAIAVHYVARPYVLSQQRLSEYRAVTRHELKIAANTQHDLVPHIFPAFPHRNELDLHACLHPALEVGGDLYDYFLSGDNLYFCIGDVSGKGVQASLFMAATHYLFRCMASNTDMSQALKTMNKTLATDNSKCTFVTFWFGHLNLITGELSYINAGHNSPILVHNGKAAYMPKASGIPLGVWEEAEYEIMHTNLVPGDTLLLYTDGVTESMDINSQQLGDKATLAIVQSVYELSSADIIDEIVKKVRHHSVGTKQSDDITMVCLKYNG